MRSIYRVLLVLLLVPTAFFVKATPPLNSSDQVPSKLYFYSPDKTTGLRVSYNARKDMETPWRGRFFQKRWWGKRLLGESDFSIRRLPAQLLVSNTGRYAAAIGMRNYELRDEFEIAIYRNDGVMIKWNYLTNILPRAELGYYPKWTHAPYWTASINEGPQELLLTPHGQLRPEIQPGTECPPLRIDLATGAVLTPHDELVPWFQSRYAFMVVPEEPAIKPTSFKHQECATGSETVDFESLPTISLQTVLDRRSLINLPPYPPLAKVARIVGLLSIEVAITNSGKVRCARYISGPPQLAISVLKSALMWEFKPDQCPGAPPMVRGMISVRGHFEIGEQSP
ncbi:energy transducer TonB [Mesoterricola sediminis]|uniref:hypothetical protein n=1 Tax=Mesoterricola sediminis TaxID=2927980 RepID=UPI002930EF7C|nr:hypothetical protein [Mesoterricola sediminis]